MSAKARRAPEESEEPENEEEEMDMDMGKKPHSRKRSAKGANNTKAPMDGGMYGKKPMDGECGCKDKKGGKCDGSCGGAMRKRGDAALTPHEYLDACDLGIQDRSRSYIRARLDAAERLDLKCGKGSISKGEKCTKGAATQVDPQAPGKGTGMRTALKVAAGVALVGAAAYGATKGSKALNARSVKAKSMMSSARKLRGQGESTMYAARKTNLRALKNEKPNATPDQMRAADIKAQLRLAEAAATKSAARSQARRLISEASRQAPPSKARMRRSVNRVLTRGLSAKRDSPYAAGFPLDSAALAI
jgi:hypothetical protein